MTEQEKNQFKLEILEEIDELLAGSEKAILQPNDPSGCYTEWVLDTERFREKLHKRIEEVRIQCS